MQIASTYQAFCLAHPLQSPWDPVCVTLPCPCLLLFRLRVPICDSCPGPVVVSCGVVVVAQNKGRGSCATQGHPGMRVSLFRLRIHKQHKFISFILYYTASDPSSGLFLYFMTIPALLSSRSQQYVLLFPALLCLYNSPVR